ncbi:MAG: alpha/beta fold hydrolase [Myxococcota bacterium]
MRIVFLVVLVGCNSSSPPGGATDHRDVDGSTLDATTVDGSMDASTDRRVDVDTDPPSFEAVWVDTSITVPDRELELRAHYPIGEGPFPLIVFSHGVWGSREHYTAFAQHWASEGYVVILPQHVDDDASMGEGTPFDDWPERVGDITATLDELEQLAVRAPELAGRIDPSRVGVAGHSFGSYIAQLVAGVQIRTSFGGPATRVADPRVAAVLVLAPQGPGSQLADDAWDTLEIPVMSMTGSRDYGRLRFGEDVAWRLEPFRRARSTQKYLTFVSGLWNDYGGATETLLRPQIEEYRARVAPGDAINEMHAWYIQRSSTAFWDAHLRGDPDAAAWLVNRELDVQSGGEAIVTSDPLDVDAIVASLPPGPVSP